MKITLCIMYTKHQKIFTSIKTSKYCTDKNSQDIERKKKSSDNHKKIPFLFKSQICKFEQTHTHHKMNFTMVNEGKIWCWLIPNELRWPYCLTIISVTLFLMICCIKHWYHTMDHGLPFYSCTFDDITMTSSGFRGNPIFLIIPCFWE